MKSLFNSLLKELSGFNFKLFTVYPEGAVRTGNYSSLKSKCLLSSLRDFLFGPPPYKYFTYNDALDLISDNESKRNNGNDLDIIDNQPKGKTLYSTSNGRSFGKYNRNSANNSLIAVADPGDNDQDNDPLAPFDYEGFLKKEGLK